MSRSRRFRMSMRNKVIDAILFYLDPDDDTILKEVFESCENDEDDVALDDEIARLRRDLERLKDA